MQKYSGSQHRRPSERSIQDSKFDGICNERHLLTHGSTPLVAMSRKSFSTSMRRAATFNQPQRLQSLNKDMDILANVLRRGSECFDSLLRGIALTHSAL
jgi:hypothetical protein